MPVLLRGLSPFSDSSRKGVDSDTVRDTCMCHLTTKLLGNKLEFRQMEKMMHSLQTTDKPFRNVLIKQKNTNLLRKVLHLDNIWFISRLIFSAFYLISWTLVLFVIFISSFFLFSPLCEALSNVDNDFSSPGMFFQTTRVQIANHHPGLCSQSSRNITI